MNHNIKFFGKNHCLLDILWLTNRHCLPFPQEKGGGEMDGIEK